MRVRVGTSGYSYRQWKGSFYPEDLPASKMLRFYAERHDTVEINNTFYRMPSRKLLSGWREQTPEDFSFVLKVPRRITHQKRLADVSGELEYLLTTSAELGSQLGPLLVQLPPFFKKDRGRLREFATLLPPGCRAAFEFRNVSWFDDEVYSVLRDSNLALVVADTDKDEASAPIVATADYGYLRLRRQQYDEALLEQWAQRLGSQPWAEAFVFFKHEEAGAGPRLAAQLKELLTV